MRKLSACLSGALAAAALGACTPMAWVRPETTAAQSESDTVDCRQWAGREAWWRAQRLEMLGWRRSDPLVDEMRLTDECLRARGYQLVPRDPKPTG